LFPPPISILLFRVTSSIIQKSHTDIVSSVLQRSMQPGTEHFRSCTNEKENICVGKSWLGSRQGYRQFWLTYPTVLSVSTDNCQLKLRTRTHL